MRVLNKGVCVEGFRAGGIKGKYGVALIACNTECDSTMMITRNRVKAAPLLVSAQNAEGKVRGIVANSGNANAFTGRQGHEDALEMCRIGARSLGVSPEKMLVASTGVIGRRLDMEEIRRGIEKVRPMLEESPEASRRAGEAILTTDRKVKSVSVEVEVEGKRVEIGGIAKGAGMIAPQLYHATMLCFLTTNAYIPEEKKDSVLEEAVSQSFNMTIIDGDMSTNDMVALLSSGEAGNSDVDHNFQEGLNYVARELARLIAKDGEGATKYLEVGVTGARSYSDARSAARAVAGSNLVKTALFGEDPNWGRMVSALGYSGAVFDPEDITLILESRAGKVTLVENGKPLAFEGTEELKMARKILKQKEISVYANLKAGKFSSKAFGCDMSLDYVRINAEYTT